MQTKKVGGEVDAMCTKCRMTLAHTILAMVGSKIARVKCNTCNGEHVYRKESGSTPSRKRASGSGEKKAEKIVVTFDERLAGKDLRAAPKYSPKDSYAVDQIVNHPTFGIGIVTAVRGEKLEIAFKADSKTLIHGRGSGAPAAKPAFSPPNAQNAGPADKPTREEPPSKSAPRTE